MNILMLNILNSFLPLDQHVEDVSGETEVSSRKVDSEAHCHSFAHSFVRCFGPVFKK